MSSFIEGDPVGILCRDFGFLPEQEGFRKIEVKIDDAHVRKGNYQYTSALVDQLKSWCSGWFDEIVVIGDGEGDIRFSINLYLGTKESCRVSGLFIRHEATHGRNFPDERNLVLQIKERLDDLRRLISVWLDVLIKRNTAAP